MELLIYDFGFTIYEIEIGEVINMKDTAAPSQHGVD